MTRCRNWLCYHHSRIEPDGCVELCDTEKCMRRQYYEELRTRIMTKGAAAKVQIEVGEDE